MKTKAEIKSDCKRFAYVYKIELSGSERTGIAVMCEDYATVFEKWYEVYAVFCAWREGKSFREACLSV